MRLQPGTSFGAYEIEALVGAGAMGEVYRATDSRLRRSVALKVLPASVVLDPDRTERFKREAQMLAALNHPNIASIYDVVEANGSRALVLEFVEGETLAVRIARGPLPLDEALAIARQIADALDSAHQRGIVHRDLKPSNIAIAPNGAVKLLDFGIAKTLEAGDAAEPPATSTALFGPLGTPAYMSPEQARGQQVDKRTDIWAFGCVLYEMATGRRAFAGDTPSDAISAVLKGTSDLDGLPARVRPLVQRCLETDVSRRLRDIGDATLWLDTMARDAVVVPSAPGNVRGWFWPAASLVLVGAIAVLSFELRNQGRPLPQQLRFEYSPPPGATLVGGAPVVSPDGRHMAFIAASSDSPLRSLWVHSFESGVSQPIFRETDVGPPVWSPDGRFIALVAGRLGANRLEKIAVQDGSRQTLFESPQIGVADWGSEDVILLINDGVVKRIPAAGGAAVALTTIDRHQGELGQYFPRFLPDGRHFVYLRLAPSEANTGLYIGSIDAKPEQQDSRRLIAGRGLAVYAPSPVGKRDGYLVFNREGTLFAQRFDSGHLQLRGDPIRIAEHIAELVTPARPGLFSASRTGVLAYRSASTVFGSPVWIDRTGHELGDAVNARFEHPQHLQLSPDGRRLAAMAHGDLWLCDLEGRPATKLTSGGNGDVLSWSPDAQRIVFEADNPFRLLSVRTDGTGSPEAVSPGGHFHPVGWSAGGHELIVTLNTYGPTGWDLLTIRGDKPTEPQPIVRTSANEGLQGAAVSSDGRWLAYASDTTGESEIYIRQYPGSASSERVSPAGGENPLWSKDGLELYYWESGTRLMAVQVTPGAESNPKPPKLLFESRNLHVLSGVYDVAGDGRFVMFRVEEPSTPPSAKIIMNWTADLPK